jgi:hypothetical protein
MKITLSLLACSAFLLPAPPGAAAEDVSPAEKALFVTNHLATLKPPTTLRYSFRKSGSLEAGFEDKVSISLRAQPDGSCCTAATEFLDGPRRLVLPEVESAQGNPVILFFLERDIREMQRLTKGQSNYFRKRIRMAVYQGATMGDASISYRGRSVPAKQITVAPYVDDPLRARFEALAEKRYVFTLSDQVPGGVVSIRSQVDGTAAKPVLVEELTLEGVARQP